MKQIYFNKAVLILTLFNKQFKVHWRYHVSGAFHLPKFSIKPVVDYSQEEITVCAHCLEEIQRVGEDSLDWCEGCNQLEGDTKSMTIAELEAAGL